MLQMETNLPTPHLHPTVFILFLSDCDPRWEAENSSILMIVTLHDTAFAEGCGETLVLEGEAWLVVLCSMASGQDRLHNANGLRSHPVCTHLPWCPARGQPFEDHHLPKLCCSPRAPGDHTLGDLHALGGLAKLLRIPLLPPRDARNPGGLCIPQPLPLLCGSRQAAQVLPERSWTDDPRLLEHRC